MHHFLASMGALAALMTLPPCGTRMHYKACHGFDRHESIAVHLVEDARAPMVYSVVPPAWHYDLSVPSCAGFDGVAPGETFVFSDVEMANRLPAYRNCSTPMGDLSGGGLTLVTDRGQEAPNAASYVLLSAATEGVATVSRETEVAGCAGRWTFVTFPWGIVRKRDPDFPPAQVNEGSEAWTDADLFDQLEPGGEPPVLVVRAFLVDSGAACPALGIPTGSSGFCVDVFHAYYEPVP